MIAEGPTDVVGDPVRRPAGEARRPPPPDLERERAHWRDGAVVAGIDEVGRGAWAGPVTVAAVILAPDLALEGLRDSKQLAPAAREVLARRVERDAPAVGVGHADNQEVDGLGLSAALGLAARRAMDALPQRPSVVLIDGAWDLLTGYGTSNELVVGGDRRCASIAAASIVAKVVRDASMVAADPRHPAYGFASNKGYGTAAHRAALEAHGPCALHRESWAPVRRLHREAPVERLLR